MKVLKKHYPLEKPVSRGSSNVLYLDGGVGGRRVMEPTSYLRGYWMGRYYGMIEAPTTDDAKLISVPESSGGLYGAEPYDGPDMPEFK